MLHWKVWHPGTITHQGGSIPGHTSTSRWGVHALVPGLPFTLFPRLAGRSKTIPAGDLQCQRLCQCKSHAQIVCRLAQHVGHADPGGPPSRNSAPVHQLSNTITTTLQCSSRLHARALMRHHNQTRCAEQPMANAETLAYAVFRQRSLQGERADFGKALLTSNTLALSYNNQGAWSKA